MEICPSTRTTRRSGKASSKVARDIVSDRIGCTAGISRNTKEYYDQILRGASRNDTKITLSCSCLGSFPVIEPVSSNEKFRFEAQVIVIWQQPYRTRTIVG
jgi:hypothetical protein